MLGRKFGMDIENLVKEKSAHHIVLKSRSYSFDNKNKAPINITRRPSINNEKPALVLTKAMLQEPIIKENEDKSKADPQSVPDHYEECVQHMMSKEKNRSKMAEEMREKNAKFFSKRAEIVQWMSVIHEKLKLFPETLFISINYMDEFTSRTTVASGDEALVALTCLFIAGKYEETYQIPAIRHLLRFSENPIEKSQMIAMEEKILDSIGFELITEIPLRYLDLFSKLIKLSPKNRCIAHYLLELALLHPNFLQYEPSLLASAGIYLVNKIRKISSPWPACLSELTGYPEANLRGCAKELCSLLEKAHEMKNGLSMRNKFSKSQYFEASKIRLQRKSQ